jgi:hypothetical protein
MRKVRGRQSINGVDEDRTVRNSSGKDGGTAKIFLCKWSEKADKHLLA